MRILFRILLTLILLSLSAQTVFSFYECCYIPDSVSGLDYGHETDSNGNQICSDGQIEVGTIDNLVGLSTNSDGSVNICQEFEDKRVACKAQGDNNICLNTAALYQIEAVYQYLNDDSSYSNMCPYGTRPYSECITFQTDVNSNPGSSNLPGGDTTGTDREDQRTSTDNTVQEEIENEFCSQAGGAYGLFVAKDICNSIADETCLFNPYLGGMFSTSLQNFDILELGSIERQSCIAKSSIKTCFDYKTEENCNGNLAKDHNNYLDESESCVWIDSSEYSQGLPSISSGICISNSTSQLSGENKFYNSYEYSFRYNLIKNPSFETTDYWNNLDETSIQSVFPTINGDNYYALEPENLISQRIDSFQKVSFTPSLFMMIQNYDENAYLSVSIQGYSYDGTPSGDGYEDSVRISEIFTESSYGFFRPYSQFGSYSPSADYLIITLMAHGSTIYIDGISLEASDIDHISTQGQIFKAFSLLSVNASNCGLCFDNLNLNYCTQNKSDLLGDCSYMTTDISVPYQSLLDNYTGKNENEFASEDNRWKSQSLSNAQLFCEMFTTQDACTDNFINNEFKNLHGLLGDEDNLCKWDEEIGCFKDSNNDNQLDVRGGDIYFRYREDFNDYSRLDYKYSSNDDGLSDFAVACDYFPPDSYVYVTGTNAQGENVTFTQSNNELIGNVLFNIYVSDVDASTLESCAKFEISPKLIIDYIVNDIKNYSNTIQSNLFTPVPLNYEELENLFGAEREIFTDGENDISLQFKDQSGNVAKEWNFSLNLDLNGPIINLISHNVISFPPIENFIQPNPLSKNTTLTFNISDLSRVDSCSYTLTPMGENPPLASYYNASGIFEFEPTQSIEYEFTLPITNSSVSGDTYYLEVTCEDMFTKQNTVTYILTVDYNTQLLLLTPRSASNQELSTDGFLNGPTPLVAVSSEKNLDSCSISFEEGSGFNGGITLNNIEDGFELEGYDNLFYYNITGTVDFSSDGIKHGTLSCTDTHSNTFTEDLMYYYDTQTPQLIDFELFSQSYDGHNSSILGDDGIYYVIGDGSLRSLNVTLNGTGSWVSGDTEMFVYSLNDTITGPLRKTQNVFGLTNESFVSGISISNYEKSIGHGYLSNVTDLYEMKYVLNFSDRAGNWGRGIITYYKDDSRPAIMFSGDIITQRGNKLYTRELNPNFELTFNSPSYRKFSCEMRVTRSDGFRILEDFEGEYSDRFEFTLDSISQNIRLDEGSPRISIGCVDIYGKTLETQEFELVYDNTPPVLRDFSLSKGNRIFFLNEENLEYLDEIHNLLFRFEDTNEDGYTCTYRFSTPDVPNYYNCHNESWLSPPVEFDSSLLQTTDAFTLIQGRTSYDPSPICSRSESFESLQATSIQNNIGMRTSINVRGECFDYVNLSTGVQSFDAIIYYSKDRLISLEFEYRNGQVYPVVLSHLNFNNVYISADEQGREILMELTNPVNQSGVFAYSSTQALDTSRFQDGRILLYAIHMENGEVRDSVLGSFEIDSEPPEVEIYVPDENLGQIYSDDFMIMLSATDISENLERFELYYGNTLLLDTSNLNQYNSEYIDDPTSDNYCHNSYCDGMVMFKGSQIGQTYDFTIKAYDRAGNMAEKTISIQRVDGVGISLRDSEGSSYVDPSRRYWITKNSAPTITFETSKVVDRCFIKPMIDSQWSLLTQNFDIGRTTLPLAGNENNGPDTMFSFDLSQISSYDLSALTRKTSSVEVVCRYNNTYYNYTRYVNYIDYLPDYVLTSSEGFFITDNPLETTIEVKSVGAYKYLNCEYVFEGATSQFPQRDSKFFIKKLDFSLMADGDYPLSLTCTDILGNVGPTKEYLFHLEGQSPIELTNVSLEDNSGNKHVPENGVIYVSSQGPFDLNINLNKRNVVCSYLIEGTDGLFSFITNLFSSSRQDMSISSNPYLFEVDSLYLPDTTNDLTIDCGSSLSQTYEVRVIDTPITVDITRTGLN